MNSEPDVFDRTDETPQVVRDVFDEVSEQMGEPTHSMFAVCRPEFYSTKIPNNVFMEGKNHEPADVRRALNQWDREMHIIEAFGAELFEIPPTKGCQDQVWCANVGLNIADTIVLAKYKASGRACEVAPAKRYFTSLGYKCIQPPTFFEGSADCKKWKDGIYFGGVGLFSTNEAFDWIEKQSGVQIIRLREINEQLYHLDCGLMIVDEENFLVTPGALDDPSIKTLEQQGNVHFTPKGIESTGLTNGIKLPEKRIYISGAFNQDEKDYRAASEWLLEKMDEFGYTVVFIDVDSYNPAGADASCSVLVLDNEPPSRQQHV